MEASFPNGWLYRKKLAVDRTKMNVTNLSNFPVLLIWNGTTGTSSLPQEMMDADGGQACKSDGSDIRFSLDKYGKDPIPFEIVVCSTNNDPASAFCEIWVCLPNVYWNLNTTFYMWWGNANATALTSADDEGKYNVWDSNFRAVHHLNTTFEDSTSLQSTGTPSGSSFPNPVSAKIRRGQQFQSANSNYASVGSESNFDFTTAMTVECWANITSFANAWMALITKGDSAWRLARNNVSSQLQFTVSTGSPNVNTGNLNTGTYYHIVGRYNGTNIEIFVNGSSVAQAAYAGPIPTNNYALYYGENAQTTGRYLNGILDEVRISNIARSNDWISACYNNQNDPVAFVIHSAPVETVAVSLAGWKRVCELTQDRTKLGGDEIHLPVPLVWTGDPATSNLPQEMFDADGPFPAKSDGSDIRITTDSNGAEQIAFEIVNFTVANDPASAKAVIWVRAKFLSASSNTKIYIWYNNPAASALDSWAAQGKQSCWRDGYNSDLIAAKYHLSDVSDASLNSRDLTDYSTGSSASGKIGSCRTFNGSSQYMQLPSRPLTDDFTIMFWMKSGATSNTGSQWWAGNGLIDANADSPNNDFGVSFLNNKVAFGIGNSDTTIQSSVTVNDNNWHHVIARRVMSSGSILIYVDGVQVASGTGNTNRLTTPTALTFGRINSGGNFYNGSMDEVCFMANAISTTRITSIYNSQNSPQTFFTVGTPTSNIFPNGWKFKAKLTQDHTQNTGDQTNFVSLLAWTGVQGTSNLPQEMFRASGPFSAKSDGSDIRITSDELGTTELPFEIVNFSTNANPASARAEIYVKVPSVSASSDISIYIWWGNSAAEAYRTYDIYGRDSVWTDYLMVFHYDSTTLTDSSGNGYDLTNNNITNSAGKIVGNAGSFNGSSSYGTTSMSAAINMLASGGFYITAWGYWNAFNSWSRIFDFGNGAPLDNIFFSNRGTGNDTRFECVNNTTETQNDQDTNLSLSTWTYIGALWRLGSGMYTIINGAQVGGASAGDTPLRQAARNNCYVGRSNWAGDSYFSGLIDELRVRKNYPANFRFSDYNTNNAPQTYWGVGAILSALSNQRIFERGFQTAMNKGFDRIL